MAFLVQVALAGLFLTHSFKFLPASWQASLLRRIEPTTITLSTQAVAQPVEQGSAQPSLEAKAAIAIDVGSGSVLWSKNPDQLRPIASITKLATVAVILRDHNPTETVTTPNLPKYPDSAVLVPLKTGERLTVSNLLKAALIPSANDAADALAIWDGSSLKNFVIKSNQQMRYWGIGDIKLADANGLNPASQASPTALANLAQLDLSNSTVKQLVATSAATAQDESGKSFKLKSTNELLSDKRFSGVKTGYTPESGQNLVAQATINGHQVITVVLNSPDRFAETLKLVNFVQANWGWQ